MYSGTRHIRQSMCSESHVTTESSRHLRVHYIGINELSSVTDIIGRVVRITQGCTLRLSKRRVDVHQNQNPSTRNGTKILTGYQGYKHLHESAALHFTNDKQPYLQYSGAHMHSQATRQRQQKYKQSQWPPFSWDLGMKASQLVWATLITVITCAVVYQIRSISELQEVTWSLPARLLGLMHQGAVDKDQYHHRKINRTTEMQFPDDFKWGTATASFQIEGAADEDRCPSIWDEFCEHSGIVANGDTGKVACDHYHRFREDVQLIKSLGTRYYRFSIAWPRIQKWDHENNASPNPPGIRFYNQLIDELIKNGIIPVPTLYHWDLPLPVQARTGGWSGDREITDLFSEYARLCFREFGDRIKMWITLNEPFCSSLIGYEIGDHAPGISPKTGKQSQPGVDVYLAGHNLLLAHAKAVDVYRSEFKESQGGSIGITLNTRWIEPKNKSDPECVTGAQRILDFELGWFADPVYFGDYPESMRRAIGSRLPTFSDEEKILLKGSSEFFGLNHYSTSYCTGLRSAEERNKSTTYDGDLGAKQEDSSEWKKTDMGWSIVPWGFRNLLLYIQKRYTPSGGIVVTENGLASQESTVEEMQNDTLRIEYYNDYISAMHEAMNADDTPADVRGYFLWSLMDNFEWAFGYGKRFGLHYVNYDTLERIPKPAVKWYRTLVTSNMLSVVD